LTIVSSLSFALVTKSAVKMW